MQPLPSRYGIELVALSRDPADTVRRHGERDGLTFTLLADPKLKVIRACGLLHQKGLRFNTFLVAGIPIGDPTRFEAIAIPTTILADVGGRVLGIDQADDDRLRGDEARIRAALVDVLGPPPEPGQAGAAGGS